MRKSQSVLIALLLSILAIPAARATCILNLRLAGPSTLVWNDLPGIKTYELQESFDNFKHSRNYLLTVSSFSIEHRSSKDTIASYIVTAIFDNSVLSAGPASDTCTEVLQVPIKADPEFRSMTRKAVVPIAGSAAGAFGGRFKTTLKLTPTDGNQHGRIVFHPLAAVASASDPSMPYSFPNGFGQTVVIDDVVAQLGQSGLGSLDIVPDADSASSVPSVEARLYNDTPEGTFGTTTAALYPFDYLEAPTLTFHVPTGPFRMNLGVRTFTATTAKALIYGSDGRLSEFADLYWPAGYTILAPVSQILGKNVEAGDMVIIYYNGSAIPFYTITENRTNDPELFVARPEQSTDVGSYVE